MQTANQTELHGSMQKSSEFILTKCDFLRLRFGLVWFGLRLFYWVGLVLNTPNCKYSRQNELVCMDRPEKPIKHRAWDPKFMPKFEPSFLARPYKTCICTGLAQLSFEIPSWPHNSFILIRRLLLFPPYSFPRATYFFSINTPSPDYIIRTPFG